MVKAVIFDIDGTLYSYDDAHAIAWKALCDYAKEQLSMDADTFKACHSAAQQLQKERLGADCAALHKNTSFCEKNPGTVLHALQDCPPGFCLYSL